MNQPRWRIALVPLALASLVACSSEVDDDGDDDVPPPPIVAPEATPQIAAKKVVKVNPVCSVGTTCTWKAQ